MGPRFICIGAPKAGTTWVYRLLSEHPDVWVPPVKELHYFDRCFPIPRVDEKKSIKRGVLGFGSPYSRKTIMRTFARAMLRRSTNDVRWAIRYFGGVLSDAWYLSLFDSVQNKVCGELTTDYCALSKEAVGHIHRLLPALRVVFLLRDPVERAWSHARMLLPDLLNKSLQEVTDEEFVDYLRHPAAKRKSAYMETLDIWEGYFPKEQLFIGFYEDIQANPRALLRNLLEFLGVDAELSSVYGSIHERVNVGKGRAEIPKNIHRLLAQEYLPELEALNRRFGGYAKQWLAAATEAIG